MKSRKSDLRTLAVLFIVSASALGQTSDIRFEKISTEHGLSQDIVRCIVQDRQGFMWFGTEDGLNRYDGYTMTVYKHDPLDSNSISSNWINCLYVDREGVLWVGTSKGLNRYDNYRDEFVPISFAGGNYQTADQITCMSEDSQGNLCAGTGHGVVRYGARSNAFARFTHDPTNPHSLSDDDVRSMILGSRL